MLKSILKESIFSPIYKKKLASAALKFKTHNFSGICKTNDTILIQLLVARNRNTSYN
jgi:hypothetical protein